MFYIIPAGYLGPYINFIYIILIYFLLLIAFINRSALLYYLEFYRSSETNINVSLG